MSLLSLDKFEALGNDFLILLDADGSVEVTAELARELCDRHRGVGADGVIRLVLDGVAGLSMELRNADGSVAETSGNGLRCAALAAVRAGVDGHELTIETVAGPVRCTVFDVTAGGAQVRVEMGEATVTAIESPVDTREAWRVDVGNPHLVLIGGHGDLVIDEIGPKLEAAVDGGQNVELVTRRDRHTLELEVFERGVGLTEACGSGSVAAAAAARVAGLVEEHVVVVNPGGELIVDLEGESRLRVALTGPARHVAAISVELDEAEPARR